LDAEELDGEEQAALELLLSFRNTIENGKVGKKNDAYTKAETYTSIGKGITQHVKDGSFELSGLAHAKTVIVPGVFKAVKSAAKTILKAKIRAQLPVARWRTLSVENFAYAKLRGNTIVFETAQSLAIEILDVSAPFGWAEV
jgi:hypothetical protein